MALLDDLQTRLDTFRTTFHPMQVAYAAAHAGRFFQGLATHSAIPQDGAEVAPDGLDTRPAYQAETWRDLFGLTFPNTLPFSLECHQYVNQAGQRGYFVVIRARVQGVTWRRSRGIGAESAQFNDAWKVIG